MNYIANISRSAGDPKILSVGPGSLSAIDRLGRALGWLSLALGALELLAPRKVARALGMQGNEGLLGAYGAREITAGILALSTDRTAGVWSRVAGDGLDVPTLLPALRADNPKRGNVRWAMALVLGITALDLACARTQSTRHRRLPDVSRHYNERSGFPKGIGQARGAAVNALSRS